MLKVNYCLKDFMNFRCCAVLNLVQLIVGRKPEYIVKSCKQIWTKPWFVYLTIAWRLFSYK